MDTFAEPPLISVVMPTYETEPKYLREAITYAYDYPQHVSDILKGAGQSVKGVLPSGMECYDPNVTQPTYDLARAKMLQVRWRAPTSAITTRQWPGS